ncbi:putative ORFan [Tupanvirus deep ocean]|uniref:ORFan n=2 Tax=Tupanvirus TaxID=2094720 RepID=A0AC62AAB8_9VIRU|nr:putative ORFan [Tupanvirus deep ocean]QKU34568.1 putative ORFan [Tupanvirus deep ocean]
MEEHIVHCMDQLYRFGTMFKTNTVDNKARTMQFGYNLGRLVVLLKKINQIHSLNALLQYYDINMAKAVIYMGLDEHYMFENKQIDFGFAIGFIQESLCQSHEIWWKPIVPFAEQEKWDEVVKVTRDTLSKEKVDSKIYYYFPVFDSEVDICWQSVVEKIENANKKILEKMH